MWVISVIYPFFLALISDDCFLSKEGYFSEDNPTIWAPLYYRAVRCLHKEGYANVCRADCSLMRLFPKCIAKPRNTRT